MKRCASHKGIFLIVLIGVFFSCATSARAQNNSASKPRQQTSSAVGNLTSEDLGPQAIEDWSTPSLKGSELKIGPEITAGPSDLPGHYSREIVRVDWRDGDPIDLYIMKPEGVKKPPVILYLYSFPFENDRFQKDDFGRFVTQDGFAGVAFATALTGQRFHTPRSLKEWFVSDLREALATSAHDVQMVLNFLAQRGDVDMDRVGIFGDGSGASIAILAAAVDPRIKTLDLIDPWGDWPDWLQKSSLVPDNERADYLKPDWLAGVAALDPVKWLPQLKTQKVRIQLVKTVTVTPEEAQKKIAAAAPPNAEIVHYETSAAFRAAVANGSGLNWIKQQTGNSAGQDFRAAAQGDAKSASPAKDSHP